MSDDGCWKLDVGSWKQEELKEKYGTNKFNY